MSSKAAGFKRPVQRHSRPKGLFNNELPTKGKSSPIDIRVTAGWLGDARKDAADPLTIFVISRFK
jgi:hypothetical protein